MTDEERLRWIRERPRRSLFWVVVHALGSLKMALALLLVLLVMSAYGALYESWYSNKLAQAHVYKAPWFLVWVVALAVNLVAVTLTRWPWQKKHAAFIVTHYGIVVILIGALVGMMWGKEGFVTLRVGEATRQLSLKEKILFVQGVGESGFFTVPFDAEVAGVRPGRPWSVDVRSGGVKVEVLDYREDLVLQESLEADALRGAGPGVELALESRQMGGSLPVVMVLEGVNEEQKRDIAGLMSARLVRSLQPRAVGTVVSERVPVREIWMVFEKAPGSPLVHTEDEHRSGWWVRMEREQDGEHFLSLRSPAGLEEEVKISTLRRGPVRLSDGVSAVTLQNFWRNLVVENGEPQEGPEGEENTAALFWVETFVLPEKAARPELSVAVLPGGRAAYEALRNGVVTASGEIEPGKVVDLGWSSWSLRLVEAATAAVVQFVPTVVQQGGSVTFPDQQKVSGIQVVLEAAGMRSEPTWVATGSSARVLLDGRLPLFLGYGFRSHRLPFEVELKGFEVPRDEGTDSPANFISRLVFTDLRTGQSVQGVAQMNSPASYPPQLWRQFVGNVYKFSQAGWDPQDLGKTTLQVLYDPGWLLKWLGSLLMCAGIFMMFYLKPYARKAAKMSSAGPAFNAVNTTRGVSGQVVSTAVLSGRVVVAEKSNS
jgi:hypothetical protein